MTKKNLKKHYYFLRMLARTHPSQKRALLKSASKEQISSLCEICLNIANGNVPVNVKKLKKYKNTVRNLAKKSISLQAKRNMLINQSGGFLPLLAPAILSALGGILGRVISKKIL